MDYSDNNNNNTYKFCDKDYFDFSDDDREFEIFLEEIKGKKEELNYCTPAERVKKSIEVKKLRSIFDQFY